MKFAVVVAVAFAAVAVDAVASPEAAVRFCYRPGEPCAKIKRAADVLPGLLEVIGESPSKQISKREVAARSCYQPEAACVSVKRDAFALADALAKAEAFIASDSSLIDSAASEKDPDKVSRGAKNIIERNALPGPVPEPIASAEASRWCRRPGEPCWKVRRAASAIAEAIAESEAKPQPEADAEASRWCLRPGEPCWKARRGLDILGRAANDILAS